MALHRTNAHPCHLCCGSEHDFQRLASGLAAHPNGGYISSRWIPTPPEIARAYDQMLAVVQPSRWPRLACRDHVGGGGGRWFAHGVIVLGLAELDELAQSIWADLQADPAWVGHIPGWNEFVYIVRLLVLAHELGHELNWLGYLSPHDDHLEAAADFWAGWLAGRLRLTPVAFGMHVFAAIGCNQWGCTHPTSPKRAKAFKDGYAAGRVQRQAAWAFHAAGHRF